VILRGFLKARLPGLLRVELVDFNRKVGPNGATGEVDVETSRAIIEVTTRRTGKLKQMQKLLSHPAMNPSGKPVILFAPNYGRSATEDIINAGAIVVRTQEELLSVLVTL